eukprot:CAMPEP_0197175274 /NCGR_PEP_ID=MMETSP1423-20130617/1543_1 /TAXON_ID=476441 /ORGANISM="Pseudo-nitzschia heimii, Strain UNC1101" /LENGTH=55 /DNA_ID=CAMNT_0042624385 /DNA_START=6 /DNA_END=170 /DNA_ORIENTATION=+
MSLASDDINADAAAMAALVDDLAGEAESGSGSFRGSFQFQDSQVSITSHLLVFSF